MSEITRRDFLKGTAAGFAAAALGSVALGTVAFASDDTLQTTVYQSDESATGYYVTFRYEDPEATRVRLKGNFSFTDYAHASVKTSLNASPDEWQDGYFNYGDDYYCDMTQNEESGIWEVTLQLPNGTYSYNFYVGGNADDEVDNMENATKVDDPANPCLVTGYETSDDVGSSSVYVPRNEEKQAESVSFEIEAPREDGKTGESFFEALEYNETTVAFGVYLPADYDPEREEPYPVLVMLHGGMGNEANWFNDGLTNIMDNIIADYGLEDTIVVTPNWTVINMKSTTEAYESLYTFLADYLFPYITETYNGSSESSARALGGLSKGGARTMYVAFNYPELCDYYFAYSSPWDTDVFGEPELDAADYESKTIFIGYGMYDTVIADCYLTENQWSNEDTIIKFIYTMNDAGIEFTTCKQPSYGHEWQTWRQLAAYSITNLLWK